MIELTATPIPADEARTIMEADAAALLSADLRCPLARRIIEALALLEIAIEALRPDPR
ncbi:hypothetical protein [Sphingobium sp. UBA5915]|uniref:hypothetical protein n=1 Tax=Sphingobium sp. UBA5915 TaxID=1947530 RepID=UPI0025EF1EB0|nr:hypothetical protein [Sphingobium sp. UBA5915]